ncbi:MAG: helix-turn-helix transcriptional regulator [Akkermansia sp.]|nr:helix-turn-helix transcriptional regulator [Akkermansia sp.]
MTLKEINEELKVRGWTNRKLADELGVNESGLGQILKGNRPLTEQLSKHIEYVLNKRKQQTFIFTVDLPEGTVQRWVPGFDSLTEEEKQKSLHAICKNIMHDLAVKGAGALTESERAELEQISGLTPERAAGCPPLAQ